MRSSRAADLSKIKTKPNKIKITPTIMPKTLKYTGIAIIRQITPRIQ